MSYPFTTAMHRRLILGSVGFFVLALLFGACSSSIYSFISGQYTFSAREIQVAVEKKFSYDQQILQIFKLKFSHPQITLQPKANRLAIALDAQISSSFMAQPVNAQLTLNSELSYDRIRRSVVLKHPQVEHLQFEGMEDEFRRQINTAAALLATQLLDNYPIYTFKSDQLLFAKVAYEPGTITVVPEGVRVQLVER